MYKNNTTQIGHSKQGSLFTLSALLCAGLFTVAAASAQTCPVYPIALSAQSLNINPGTTVNIWNGAGTGSFGWLSWTGDAGEPTLVDSLAMPGNSYTYINPDNANDHTLVPGDWVSCRPGVSNGKHVRANLNALIGTPIIVPVWDTVRGTGDNLAYHIIAFANVQIVSYDLPHGNQINATFLGYTSCGGGGGVN